MSDNIFKKGLIVWIISGSIMFSHLGIYYSFYKELMVYLGLSLFIDVFMIGIFMPIFGALFLCMKLESLPDKKSNIKFYFAQPVKYMVGE